MTELGNDTRVSTDNLINRRYVIRPGQFMVDGDTKKFSREDSSYDNTIYDNHGQIYIFRTMTLREKDEVCLGKVY